MVDVGASVPARSPASLCRAPSPPAQFIASRIAVMSASTAPSVQAASTDSIVVGRWPCSFATNRGLRPTIRFQLTDAQPELTLDDGDRTWTHPEAAILSGLRDILINPKDTSFGDTQHAMSCIGVCYDESNFFGRAEPGEEAKLIIVALGFAPILMDGSNQDLCILDTEGIDRRPIVLADPGRQT